MKYYKKRGVYETVYGYIHSCNGGKLLINGIVYR